MRNINNANLKEDLIVIFLLTIIFNFIDLFFGFSLLGLIFIFISIGGLLEGTSYTTDKYQKQIFFWGIFFVISVLLYFFYGKIWIGNFFGTAKMGYDFLIFLKELFNLKK